MGGGADDQESALECFDWDRIGCGCGISEWEGSETSEMVKDLQR